MNIINIQNRKKFLKDNLKMCEKAVDFLKKYVKQWLEIKDNEGDIVKEEIQNSFLCK